MLGDQVSRETHIKITRSCFPRQSKCHFQSQVQDIDKLYLL